MSGYNISDNVFINYLNRMILFTIISPHIFVGYESFPFFILNPSNT